VEAIEEKNNSTNASGKVILGNLGVRLFGTIGNKLGYYLQATNGTVLSGERSIALSDEKLRQNVKFSRLNSDFDFSESHVRLDLDWFYAEIGRETRLEGAGLNQRLYTSANAPPYDALSLGVKFSNFEYRFTHGSLIAFPTNSVDLGSFTEIPSKYYVQHRFSIRPEWGEISYWESIIYYNRGIDLTYLNPLSFLKSMEHALHDRDNSMMGGDLTFRFLNFLQLKGTFLLDDIQFSEIGKGFWGNKTASNIALIAALPANLDVGIEYARVEPYTFTHFNQQNSATNDSLLFCGDLPPNSEEYSALVQYWWGDRYPVVLNLSYRRHGANIYDNAGNLIKNVGGDVLQTKRPEDSEYVTFLDGIRENSFNLQIQAGWEFIRNFSLHGACRIYNLNGLSMNYYSLSLRFEDF
jgi:hypothetical protein